MMGVQKSADAGEKMNVKCEECIFAEGLEPSHWIMCKITRAIIPRDGECEKGVAHGDT